MLIVGAKGFAKEVLEHGTNWVKLMIWFFMMLVLIYQ